MFLNCRLDCCCWGGVGVHHILRTSAFVRFVRMLFGFCCGGWSSAGHCIFVVVAVPIAWKATNALYGFFVVFLFLVLGRGVVLGPTRCRFCLVGVVVVLFLPVVLDGAVGAVVSCIKGDVRAAATAAAGAMVSSSGVLVVGLFFLGSLAWDCGAVVVIFVVVFIAIDFCSFFGVDCLLQHSVPVFGFRVVSVFGFCVVSSLGIVGFGSCILVSVLVITGAVDSGRVCAVGVISGLCVLVVLSVIVMTAAVSSSSSKFGGFVSALSSS